MSRGRAKRELLQTGGDRVSSPHASLWLLACRCGVGAAAVWFAMAGVTGCTQNLVATESSSSLGGSTALTCAGQECSGQCCAGFECKNGRCTAADAGFTAGPGSVCNETSDCMQLWGQSYACESVENTKLCLSPYAVVENGKKCQISADCSSLNCEGGICKAGSITCGVSGASCNSPYDCCSHQCSDRTCTNTDPTCRVVGDTCNPITPDCCNNNSCAKIGSTFRCVATYGCRGTHDVCGEIDCCIGSAVCTDHRCVDSCTQRDNYCKDPQDCCSKKCIGEVCVALDGCQPLGDKCTNWWDCCSKNCDAKWGRCVPSPTSSSCGLEGETCSDRSCCPGDTGKLMACVADVLGVKRCSSQTGCIENRKVCAFGGQCCGDARCDYDLSLDTFACNGYCRSFGDYCTRNAECCGNYCSPITDTCVDAASL